MQPLHIFQLLFWLAVYCASVSFGFFVPGFVLSRRVTKNLSSLEQVVLSLSLGVVLWGIQGYVFGYLHIRQASFVYVIASIYLAFVNRVKIIQLGKEFFKTVRRFDRILQVILVIGISMQVLQMIGTGLMLSDGMPFFRVHARDGIFHLGLIASISRQFPPVEPGASAVPVVNYHYWSDLVLAETSRVFGIPIHSLFFQFTPLLFSPLTALACLMVVRKMSRSFSESLRNNWQRFALFFLFFGSDMAYVFMQKLYGVWGFYTSNIDDGSTQFLNMPHVFAKALFFVGLFLLLHWKEEKKLYVGLLCGLIASVLFGMKIYFALLFLCILFAYGFFEMISLIRHKKWSAFFSQYLLVGFVSALLAAAIYLPPNSGSGGLNWYPLEWVKLMIGPQNLDWKDLNYRIAIAQYYNDSVKLALYNTIAIITTLLCIHGTRLVGLLFTPKMAKKIGCKFYVAALGAMLLFTFLGMTTLQQSGSFNVFNFFASSLTLFALLGAFWAAYLWESKHIVLRILVVIACVLTVPRGIYETNKILTSYRQGTDVVTISKDEIEALSYIKTNAPKDAVVQAHMDNSFERQTTYVSYFANRQVYIGGQSVLETHNQPTAPREEEMRLLFASTDPNLLSSKLKEKGISYLYVRKQDTLRVDPTAAGLQLVYSNGAADVYTTVEER